MVNYDGLYNKELVDDKFNENHFSTKKLRFKIIANGTILPHQQIPNVDGVGFGGIIDGNGNYVAESWATAPRVEAAYTPSKELEYIPETVIYFGMLLNIWGHCLFDNVKRLWFFNSADYKDAFKKCKIVYVPMWYGIIPPFAKLLEIMGFNVNNLRAIVRPMKFQAIIIPDISFFPAPKGGGTMMYTAEYVETIERARHFAQKNFSPLPQKKFYFFHGRNQFGEGRLARYFNSKGYETISPETLPMEEQLNILANCESFASTLGSIAHNTLFVKDGTETLLIPRTSAGVSNPYQNVVNQMRDLNVSYVDTSLTMCSGLGPYCYIISENLRKHFGDEVTKKFTDEDFETSLAYRQYIKNSGLQENPQEFDYLKNILPEFWAQLKTRDDLLKKFGAIIK